MGQGHAIKYKKRAFHIFGKCIPSDENSVNYNDITGKNEIRSSTRAGQNVLQPGYLNL